jgi:hypothetical protein
LAAQADWEQQFGHLELNDDGELIDKNTGKPVETGEATGYTRNEKGEWMKDGKPIFGRQFNVGEGNYDPSKFAAGVNRDATELKAVGAEYGHKETNWKKPDWMKVSVHVYVVMDRFCQIQRWMAVFLLSSHIRSVHSFPPLSLGQIEEN